MGIRCIDVRGWRCFEYQSFTSHTKTLPLPLHLEPHLLLKLSSYRDAMFGYKSSMWTSTLLGKCKHEPFPCLNSSRILSSLFCSWNARLIFVPPGWAECFLPTSLRPPTVHCNSAPPKSNAVAFIMNHIKTTANRQGWTCFSSYNTES